MADGNDIKRDEGAPETGWDESDPSPPEFVEIASKKTKTLLDETMTEMPSVPIVPSRSPNKRSNEEEQFHALHPHYQDLKQRSDSGSVLRKKERNELDRLEKLLKQHSAKQAPPPPQQLPSKIPDVWNQPVQKAAKKVDDATGGPPIAPFVGPPERPETYSLAPDVPNQTKPPAPLPQPPKDALTPSKPDAYWVAPTKGTLQERMEKATMGSIAKFDQSTGGTPTNIDPQAVKGIVNQTNTFLGGTFAKLAASPNATGSIGALNAQANKGLIAVVASLMGKVKVQPGQSLGQLGGPTAITQNVAVTGQTGKAAPSFTQHTGKNSAAPLDPLPLPPKLDARATSKAVQSLSLGGLLGRLQKRIDDPESLVTEGGEQAHKGRKMQSRGKAGGHLQEMLGRSNVASGKLFQSVQAESSFESASKGLEAMGSLGGKIPLVGKAVEGVAKLGSVAFKSMERIEKWGDQLHESNMKFAEFSGAMASVQAQQEVRDIQYSKERGDARSKTAKELAEAKSRARNSWAGFTDKVKGTWDKVATGLNNAVDKLGRFVGAEGKEPTEITERLTDPERIMVRDEKFNEGFTKMFLEPMDGEWSRTYGQPPRFKGL